MSGKRTGAGPGDNPWVRRPDGSQPDDGPEVEAEPPPSPWDYPVDPPPDAQGGARTGDPGADLTGGTPAGGEKPGDPADGIAPWGVNMGPPSLRRPPPEPKRELPRLLLPILAGVVAIVVVGVLAVVVLGGGEEPGTAQPTAPPTSQSPVQTPTPAASSYTPPANAIPVAFGVSVVPVQGWTIFTAEKQGKQLVVAAPNGHRAFFWVRQRQNVSAKDYVIRIAEGETVEATGTQMSRTQTIPCPRDVLVECASITYSTVLLTKQGRIPMRGVVQAYRRKDGVVTAMDFQSRPDYYTKSYADAQVMLKSVIDSQ